MQTFFNCAMTVGMIMVALPTCHREHYYSHFNFFAVLVLSLSPFTVHLG